MFWLALGGLSTIWEGGGDGGGVKINDSRYELTLSVDISFDDVDRDPKSQGCEKTRTSALIIFPHCVSKCC